MTPTIQLQLLLATFAGWIRLRQSRAISYLIEENRVLKEQLESSGKRILFTDDQRRRLAAKGKPLGRKALEAIATICHARYDHGLAPKVHRRETDLFAQ